MLRNILKWTGIVLGTVVVLALVGYFAIASTITSRTEKKYAFASENLTIPTDTATLKKGEHLAIIKGCVECHGENLAGKVMMEDEGLGRLIASNLTKGKGGIPADYQTQDWVMALRHGVDKTGRPLLFMPSHETTLLSQGDIIAIIAYCQQMAPVDRVHPANDLGPIMKLMTFADKMPLLSVEKIDHNKPMVAQVDTTIGIAQGKYLAISCSGCHRPDLKGGDPLAPGMPPVPNITSSGRPGTWSQSQFMQTLRTGKTPVGHQIDNKNMPWKMTAQYKDSELISLYRYVQSLQ